MVVKIFRPAAVSGGETFVITLITYTRARFFPVEKRQKRVLFKPAYFQLSFQLQTLSLFVLSLAVELPSPSGP